MAFGKDESKARAERLKHWQNAESWLERCRAIFIDMTERGLLWQSDAGVADGLSADIENCRAAAAELETVDKGAGDP